MQQNETTWADVLAEAGCYGFLAPAAAGAVGGALARCPEAATLLDAAARSDLRRIVEGRLGSVYERALVKLALGRRGLSASLALSAGGGVRTDMMRRIAMDASAEVAADGGASLRAGLPFVREYVQAIAANCTGAISELIRRLVRMQGEVSAQLLGERHITRVMGISARGADPHRHGRMVLRIDTDAGSFFYKPHECSLDGLYDEIAGCLFARSCRAAQVVPGDGFAFVECLLPEEPTGEEGLRAYWRNLGRLAALFHGLGSRDMTQDNIMCCGQLPAVLDLETLLTGEVDFDETAFGRGGASGSASAHDLADSVACTGVLPMQLGGRYVSPLVADNALGTCLPHLHGEPHTVRGFEQDFRAGFEEGYRHLMRHSDDLREVLHSHADAVCRLVLLNTRAYARCRSLLFSPGALRDPVQREKVLAGLGAEYAVFSNDVREAVAEHDAAALMEGDIPYYWSRAGSRMLFAGDGSALGELLVRSALEAAEARLARLSDAELRFELSLIDRYLAAWGDSEDRP